MTTHAKTQYRGIFLAVALTTGLVSQAMADQTDLGQGLIFGRATAANADGRFVFQPAHHLAFAAGTGDSRSRWLLLTDQDPNTIVWRGHASHSDALAAWCKTQSAGYVLVEINPAGSAELLTQCIAGAMSVAMISTINGLDSVQLKYDRNEPTHISGALIGGSGSCGSDEDVDYCEQTMDYRFDTAVGDAPALK